MSNGSTNSYADIYNNLNYGAGTIIFFKKDGTVRVMLATRNMDIMQLADIDGSLSGRDRNCNIKNGNIAVFDILKGEPRCFNVDRVTYTEFYNNISNADDLNKLVEKFKAFEEEYFKVNSTKITMDDLD